MKNVLIGVASVFSIYMLFITNLDISWKNLILGIFCNVIIINRSFMILRKPHWPLIFYIFVIINAILLLFLLMNVVFEFGANTIFIWSSYIVVTVVALVVASASKLR